MCVTSTPRSDNTVAAATPAMPPPITTERRGRLTRGASSLVTGAGKCRTSGLMRLINWLPSYSLVHHWKSIVTRSHHDTHTPCDRSAVRGSALLTQPLLMPAATPKGTAAHWGRARFPLRRATRASPRSTARRIWALPEMRRIGRPMALRQASAERRGLDRGASRGLPSRQDGLPAAAATQTRERSSSPASPTTG